MPSLQVLTFVTRKPALNPLEFRKSFEKSHVPLADELVAAGKLSALTEYQRNYLLEGRSESTVQPVDVGFDLVVCSGFADREGYGKSRAAMAEDPEVIRQMVDDAALWGAEDGVRHVVAAVCEGGVDLAARRGDPLKLMIFIKRNPALTPEQFQNVFETSHVPLTAELVGTGKLARLIGYRRNYLQPGQPESTAEPSDLGFDLIVENTFQSGADYLASREKMAFDPEVISKLTEEQQTWCHPEGTRVVVVETEDYVAAL